MYKHSMTPIYDIITVKRNVNQTERFSILNRLCFTCYNTSRWFSPRAVETTDFKHTGAKHKVMWLTSDITVLSFSFLHCDNKNRTAGRGLTLHQSFHKHEAFSRRLLSTIGSSYFHILLILSIQVQSEYWQKQVSVQKVASSVFCWWFWCALNVFACIENQIYAQTIILK